MPLDDTKHSSRDRMVEFALHDRALVSARIFRPMGRGVGSKLDDEKRTEDTVTVNDPALGPIQVKVVAAYPVGTKEEDILLVLLGFAGLNKKASPGEIRALTTNHPEHPDVVKEIDAKGDCLGSTFYQIRISPYLLLKELSGDPEYRPSKLAYDELTPRLERLRWVGYTANGMKGNNRWNSGGSQLLSYQYIEGDDKDKTIVVTFNERIARIMVGYFDDKDDVDSKPRRWYSKISLRERFSLRSDVSRMVHRLFSVWIDEPKSNVKQPRKGKLRPAGSQALAVKVDTLITHIYGPRPVSATALRHRRSHVRQALSEVANLDAWSIDMDESKTTAFVRRLPQTQIRTKGLTPL